MNIEKMMLLIVFSETEILCTLKMAERALEEKGITLKPLLDQRHVHGKLNADRGWV